MAFEGSVSDVHEEVPTDTSLVLRNRKRDDVETEKLIQLVANEECLWRKSDKSYKKATYKLLQWKRIAVALGEPGNAEGAETVKKRWDNLRSQYVRKLKTLPSGDPAPEEAGSEWQWFHHMSFVRDQITKKKTISSLDVCTLNTDEEVSSPNTSSQAIEVVSSPPDAVEKHVEKPAISGKKRANSDMEEVVTAYFGAKLKQKEQEQEASTSTDKFASAICTILRTFSPERKKSAERGILAELAQYSM